MSVVAVAQLVESRIVIPAVVGSSPIGHPIFKADLLKLFDFVRADTKHFRRFFKRLMLKSLGR